MEFKDQIKQIRKQENLTQEQFARRLHVTRQAISNWENGKHLPDIEMLLHISDIFHVSLDVLIKGEDEMNDMREKVIKDGSETRRARYNMITSIVGGVLLFMGAMCLVIKGMSVEYIDEYGILHENFFLLPIGFSFLFAGVISFLSIGLRKMIKK